MSGGWGSGSGDGGWKPGGKKKAGAPAPRDPQKEMFRALGRLLAGDGSGRVARSTGTADRELDLALRGMAPRRVRRAARDAELTGYATDLLVDRARKLRKAARSGTDGDEGGLLGVLGNPVGAAQSWATTVLRETSRPVQATTSVVGEWSRQGEKNPVQVGPVSLRFGVSNPGEILDAGVEGFKLERHDSPTSIAMEAGRTRARQGAGTESFGFVPGTNLEKGEALPGGTAGKIVYDVGGSAALDPLTYLTFGTGAAARAGISATERVLGAERAAQVAARGVGVLTTEERARLGVDVLRRLRGVRPGVAVRAPQPIRALRTGENLLAPPRTVVPFGPVADAAGKAGRAAMTSKAGAPLRGIERAFVPRAGVKQAVREGRLPASLPDELDRMRVAFNAGADASQDLRLLAHVKKTHKLTDGETDDLMRALESTPDGLAPKVRGAYDDMNDYRLRLAAEKRQAGVIYTADPELREFDEIPDDRYMPHVQTGAEKKVAEKRAKIMTGGGPSVTVPEPGFAKRRTIREDVFTANDEYGQAFETNPFLALAQHVPEARKAIATRKYVDDALRLVDADEIPLLRRLDDLGDVSDDALRDAGLVKVEIPREGTFAVDAALATDLRKLARLASGDETTNAFLRGLDRWMTLWKGYATVPLPFGVGFHMRNGVGNVTLNWLADINPIDPAYAQAWKMQRLISKGMAEGDAMRYVAGTKYEAYTRAALDRDIIGSAFHITDIPPDLGRPFKSTGSKVVEAVNPLDEGNLLIRGGRRVGIEIEENARLAHFIAKYREYGNFDDAAASVRKYLFDYSDLTPFEQDVMKRLMPFYTFTRKNTPLWLAAAFKQPGKFSRIAEWQEALTSAAGGYPDGPMPNYLEASAAVPIPGVQSDGNPVMFAPDLPPMAASEVLTPAMQLAALVPGAKKLGLEPAQGGVGEPLRSLGSLFGGGAPGLAKSLAEAYLGEREWFTGRPFYPGERVAAPSWLAPATALGIVPERIVEGEMRPSIPRTVQHIAESNMPLLWKLRALFPTDARDEDKQVRRGVSMLTGVQAYPLGEATERGELFRRVELLRRRLSELAAQGVEIPDLAPTRRKANDGW